VLARVPIERVRTDAVQVQWGRVALGVVVGVLYGLGYGISKAVRWLLAGLTMALYATGRAAGWAFAAVRLGWQDAQAPPPAAARPQGGTGAP
jgi:hypothetical protein